jgi:hypothetical protein
MATCIKCEKAQGNNTNQVRITLLNTKPTLLAGVAQKFDEKTLEGELLSRLLEPVEE